MALSIRLDLRQSQSLVMTPQLQQWFRLLRMSNMELTEYVEDELLQNPLLERDESATEQPAETANGAEAATTDQSEESGDDPVDSLDRATADSLPADGDAPLDTDFENVWNAKDAGAVEGGAVEGGAASLDSQRIGAGGRSDFSELSADIEATLSQDETLRDHLLRQLAIDIADPGDRIIGLHLIESLDEAGRLTGEMAGIAGRLGCPVSQVELVLAQLQQFDPPGIFARDLAECFALQLQDRNRCDPAMRALLDNLVLFQANNRTAMLKVCGVDEEDLDEMIAEIRSLDAKPAEAFTHEIAQTIVPDILMRRHAEGGWLLELNPDSLPKVLVNRRYTNRIRREARKSEDQEYLNEKYSSANWLINALHQRRLTILKVASEIVRQQDAFFEHGVRHMKPLVLRDIADVIDIHESTVSRVTSNKYMETPRGVFELKYFFTSALSSTTGGVAHSAEAVRHRIKELCARESLQSILSDDDIAEALSADGIDIARRTVAKYRKALRIPSSVQRRRMKTST